MNRACRFAGAGTVAALIAGAALVSSSAQQPPAQDPQRPVFRADAHFVRVDAYPSKDGRIIPGLTAADFEVLEDGKPQTIDTLEFIEFTSAVETERRDPNSQRDGFSLASDPRYRLFVIYLDIYNVGVSGSHASRRPLVDMLNRMLGARDLFGVLTPHQEPTRDLLLGQKTLSIEEQLAKHWTWGMSGTLQKEPDELHLEACFGDTRGTRELQARWRMDKVFSNLEEIITILDGLRQERKNIILFSRGWLLPGENMNLASPSAAPPSIGVTDAGKPTLGNLRAGDVNPRWCQDQMSRLASIDFMQRHRDMLRQARQANVTFYPVNPGGLEVPGVEDGRMMGALDNLGSRMDRLRELASNTDGIPIVNTNDLRSGLQRIADDLAAYYVLGYYTTNTKWDGSVRRITVRLKPAGTQVRARREYRAPTEAEMATLRAPRPAAAAAGPTPVDDALGTLTRLRPGAGLYTYGRAGAGEVAIVAELSAPRVEAGRWKSGGELTVVVTTVAGETVGSTRARIEPGARAAIVRVPTRNNQAPYQALVRLRGDGEEPEEDQITIRASTGVLLGDPLLYRAAPAPASPLRPVAGLQFRRTERIAIEWPLLKPVDRRHARLLGRDGKPVPITMTVTERGTAAAPVLAADLNLAPLTAGDYLVEMTASSGDTREQRIVAFRVFR